MSLKFIELQRHQRCIQKTKERRPPLDTDGRSNYCNDTSYCHSYC